MSERMDNGGGDPAFPAPGLPVYVDGVPMSPYAGYGWAVNPVPGMSERMYAAIHLRQPSSGIPWLDEMIMSAKRDDIAERALTGELASTSTAESAGAIGEAAAKAGREAEAQIAFNCYNVADAMLGGREVQP